jgi:hypothetical protein
MCREAGDVQTYYNILVMSKTLKNLLLISGVAIKEVRIVSILVYIILVVLSL